MYSLHAAQLRLAVIRLAANRAVDRAMRRMHDLPATARHLEESTGLVGLAAAVNGVAANRFHERMKTDPSNCRWCGLAQREALEELEAQP